tara:strand:- start:1058 stop:1471 length:414 start_codon:yes stop_codon:yes gene_type:complete
MEFNLSEILIIDDDETIKFVECKMLRRMSFIRPIHCFKNGLEGLEFLRSQALDQVNHVQGLILLDLHMPVMDGWEFLNEFVRLDPLIISSYNIIIRSSSDNRVDIERAYSIHSIKEYLIKPLRPESLLSSFVKHGFV